MASFLPSRRARTSSSSPSTGAFRPRFCVRFLANALLHSRLPYLSHTLLYAPSSASLHPITRSTFVTGSASDEWVRVHDAESGRELEVGKGHHGPVHCVAYSPDGELYASGSEDGLSLSALLSSCASLMILYFAGTIRLWQTSPKTYGLWQYNEEPPAAA